MNCPVRKGQVICEISGVSPYLAQKALIGASRKLPFKTGIVKICY
jgi:ribosomal protein L16/L10AE